MVPMTKTRHLSRYLRRGIGLSALGICVLVACDYRPTVTIEGGLVPKFTLTGRGLLHIIEIDGPDFDRPNGLGAGSRYMKPYWQIVPLKDYDVGTLEKHGPLVYGEVPEGFRQVIPENGAPAPPLVENELLTFSCGHEWAWLGSSFRDTQRQDCN